MDAPLATATTTERSRLWSSRLALPLLLLAFTLLVRAVSFFPTMINPDESIFALAAREVVHGHLPYLTLFDNKPVGSTLLIALAYSLIGESILSVRLVGALCVWLSGLLLGALAQRGGLTRLEAMFSALLYIVFASTMGGLATMTEIILTPFTLAAVLLLYKTLDPAPFAKRLMLACAAGLACGGAILVKIVPVVPGFAVAGLILLLLLRRRELSFVGAAALGIGFALCSLLPMVSVGLVYAAAGALNELIYSNFGFASAYSSIRPGLGAAAQRLGTVLDSLWPLLGLATIALIGSVGGWRRKRSVETLLLVASVWLLGELAAAAASRHFWPHYFLAAIPPLALMSVFGVRALVAWLGVAKTPARTIALLSGIAVLIPLERTQVDALRELNAGTDIPRQVAVAIAGAAAGGTPTLFVTNYQLSVVYSLTGAPLPPTRYAVPPHLFSRQSAMIKGDPAAEVARVLASDPAFIVIDRKDRLPPWASALLDKAFDERYRLIDSADSVEVYQRMIHSQIPPAPDQIPRTH